MLEKCLLRATPLDVLDRLQLVKTFGDEAHGAYGVSGQPLTAFTGRLRPRVAKMIETLIRLVTYVHAPDLIDGKAALDQLKLSFGGVLYVDGGWGELVAGLAASAACSHHSALRRAEPNRGRGLTPLRT